jgi:hypothetical protein
MHTHTHTHTHTTSRMMAVVILHIFTTGIKIQMWQKTNVNRSCIQHARKEINKSHSDYITVHLISTYLQSCSTQFHQTPLIWSGPSIHIHPMARQHILIYCCDTRLKTFGCAYIQWEAHYCLLFCHLLYLCAKRKNKGLYVGALSRVSLHMLLCA